MQPQPFYAALAREFRLICIGKRASARVVFAEHWNERNHAHLPAGCDWYNFWTNERLHGGQTITADAPIDVLPLFVRVGSIVPLGSEVQSGQQPQTIASVRVYPGADGRFRLFQDDGKTYAYEKGGGYITKLIWDDAAHQLKHEGTSAWSGSDNS